MKTTQTQITEADVIGFFQSKQAELRKATGVHYACVRFDIDGHTGDPKFLAYVDGAGIITEAATVDGAIAAMLAHLSPDNRPARAKQARERAAQLLAEAEQLEATK